MLPLFTQNVITVSSEQRLSDVSGEIRARSPSHCVVVEEPRGDFVGIVRLKDALSQPTNRIFADLVSRVPAITLEGKNTSVEVAAAVGRRNYEEVVILSNTGKFLGVVTRNSLTAWMSAERSRLEEDLAAKLKSARRLARRLAQQLKEQSSRLDEAMGHFEEFSYVVSHDVRAPLRAVRGYAEALSEDYGHSLDATANDYVARIIRASHRLDVLVLGILTYSQIARTRVTLETVNLNAVLAAAIKEKVRAHPRVAIFQAEPLAPVLGHGPLLSKCISHLLDFAFGAVVYELSPRISLRTEQVVGRVRLIVEDNGADPDRVLHDRIFEAFQGAPSAMVDDGSSIDLAIVRKAAEKMRGSLLIERIDSGGVRTTLELPRPAQV